MLKTEKETILNFNEGEHMANVYTYNKRLIKRLLELEKNFPNEVVGKISKDGCADFEIPKGWVRINPPRRVAELSEEQKAQRVRLLQSGIKNKNKGEHIGKEAQNEL